MAGNKYITKDLIDTGIDLTYKGKAIPVISDLSRTIYVSANGDNTIALLGRIDRPFKTIQAALDSVPTHSWTHIIVLAGTYSEMVVNTRANIYAVIQLMPGVRWYGATAYAFLNTASSYLHLKADRHSTFIWRGNSGTDGAVYTAGHIMDCNIESVISHAVKLTYSCIVDNCRIKSTGGDALVAASFCVIKGSNIESTLGSGIINFDINMSAPTVMESTVIGNTYGIYFPNKSGYKIRNSFVEGKTNYCLYSGNWNEGVNIENSIIKGFSGAIYLWDNNTYPDRVKHIKNATLLAMDTTVVNVSNINVPTTWYLRDVIVNKPFHLQDQLALANNIIHLPNMPFINQYHAWLEN